MERIRIVMILKPTPGHGVLSAADAVSNALKAIVPTFSVTELVVEEDDYVPGSVILPE